MTHSSNNPDVPRWILWPVFILLVTPIALAALFGNHATKEQLLALRQVVSETPVYPEFVPVKSSEFDKLNYASITITYSVPAYSVAFDDVKAFYSQGLTAKGWQTQATRDTPVFDSGGDREGHVTFRKGDYRITIEPENNARYNVTYKWDRL